MWKETAWSQALDWEGEPVLLLAQSLPEPEGEGTGAVRLRRYYRRLGALWRERWAQVLYPRACAALAEAREASRPFQPWRAGLEHQITWDDGEVVSLWVDVTEARDKGRSLTVRSAGTWRQSSGAPVALKEVLPEGRHWRRTALEEVRRQIGARLAGGESLLYPDAAERAAGEFSPRRFYLTEEGPVLFYPLYALGAHAEGLPRFPLPGREGPL